MAKKKSAKKAAKKPAKKIVKKTAKKTASKKAAPKKAVKKVASKKAAPKKAAPKAEPRVTTINPYLTFAGNCEEAFNHYRSVFGGNFAWVGRFKEMPPMEGHPLSEAEGNLIMHISLPISKETILMGSDSSEKFGQATIIGNNFSVSVNTVNNAKADKIFNGLSDGGKVTMPMENTFWGSYFGMCVDKFGIQWMVSVEAEKK